MFDFRATVSIKSSPSTIWALLTDASAYPSWNTSVERVEGHIAPGSRLVVYAKVSPGRGFPVRVAKLEPERRMVWRGGMPIGFLFKGVRTFTLTPAADGAVSFDMHEVFSGVLSGPMRKVIPNLQPAFDEFAACLKTRAEE